MKDKKEKGKWYKWIRNFYYLFLFIMISGFIAIIKGIDERDIRITIGIMTCISGIAIIIIEDIKSKEKNENKKR